MRKVDLSLVHEIRGNTPLKALPSPGTSGQYGKEILPLALSHILKELETELGIEAAIDGQDAPTNLDLEAAINRIAQKNGLTLASFERDQLLLQIEREKKPFGILQPLVDDPAVSDIIVSSYNSISVQEGRKNYKTDLSFPNVEAFEAFVERLLLKANSTYSTKKPIADGMIGSFARVHAVHRALCDEGPYLTIRLNRFSKVAVSDLMVSGMAPKPVFDYLLALIHHGITILIVGEVGTGKTTLARALASSIPTEESILVIEDTPEIRLEHPHVRYVTTRDSNSDGAGRVSPSECIRAGMRMAMNRIVFGEIRDAEAAEAFLDVCASGHPGLSTLHARSGHEAAARLILFLGRAQRGVDHEVLAEQVATAVQVVVFVNICNVTGKRRIMEVKEIGPVADGMLRQREIFRYQCANSLPAWKVSNKISGYRDLIEKEPHLVSLSALPPLVELDPSALYSESQRSNQLRRT